ncbi:MAG: hypothetical protein WED82_07235 [Balneolales bacterium]
MTKCIFPFLLFGFICITEGQAQETQTLFNNDIRHGGFGALVYGATSVNGQAAYLRGTRGAWAINFTDEHAANVGFGTYRTHSDFEPADWASNASEPEMRMNYSGFELEYVNRTQRLFHFSIQTLIGSGRIRYRDPAEGLEKTSDSYFALKPGANINLNITTWFKISGGLFYRYVGGANLEGTSDSGLSGMASFVGLRFGKF